MTTDEAAAPVLHIVPEPVNLDVMFEEDNANPIYDYLQDVRNPLEARRLAGEWILAHRPDNAMLIAMTRDAMNSMEPAVLETPEETRMHAEANFQRLVDQKALERYAFHKGDELAKQRLEEEKAEEWRDSAPLAERLRLVDFATLGVETEEPAYAIPRMLPEGSYVAFYSAAGLGKSLLVQEAAVAVATGGEFLGETCKQRRVLYLDMENPRSAIRDRMESLGVPLTDDLTAWLHYSHLADWSALDSKAGGAMLLEAVDELGAEVVILDTTMRAIDGLEDKSDTFNGLYRHVVYGLKARNVAFLRLDHVGKDPEKGQRGSSAKEGAEDLTWQLEPGFGDDRYVLRRKKNRLGLEGTGVIALHRLSDPLRHLVVTSDPAREDKIEKAMIILDLAGAPLGIARRAAKAILTEHEPPLSIRNDALGDALERRRRIAGLGGAE